MSTPAPIVGRTATSIAEVVESGLCIGCGLCEALSGGSLSMSLAEHGAMRPAPVDGFGPGQEAAVLAACPGVVAPGRGVGDAIWGPASLLAMAWSGEPDVRHRAATGGVLTALGRHLLATDQVSFVLHVGPDPDAPMRSRWVMSETPEDVLANAGSRYGPTAPLAGLQVAVERNEPFAVIAKPCDIGAVAMRARADEGLRTNLVATMAMVCGGQSRLSKSQAVLDDFGLTEDQLQLFRYRGYGNPGATRIETAAGTAHEKSYLEMWEDESGWDLDARCTICPDALGEMADVAAADAWPGGAPTGEDDGFNAIAVRSEAGRALVNAAVESGHLVLGEEMTAREFDHLQPHQERKKVALRARFEGRATAGLPTIATPGLRLDECAEGLDPERADAERAGTERRAGQGRYSEVAVRLEPGPSTDF